jgi:N-methylhydantoinase B
MGVIEGGIAVDLVSLEILRSRLAAVADEAAFTIERTAMCPLLTESRDYGFGLTDAKGSLIAAGGAIPFHFGVAGHAVRATMAKYGDSIAPGDVFFANDPHSGGGLHPNDVVVQVPIFVGEQLIGWAANTGHMLDLGGMVFGSWSAAATDCYMEALRLPPVRLFRQGVETDIWAAILTNTRLPQMIEMDLKALLAGCNVARDKVVQMAESMGVKAFLAGTDALNELAEREMRRRISALQDGEYRYTTWAERGEKRFKIPCVLTVDGDQLIFDYEGAPPQEDYLFNTKDYIIHALVTSDVSDALVYDLPLSEGMYAPITVRCPEGSILNSKPPAPCGSAHIDVGSAASMAAQQCVFMAMQATSGDVPGKHLISGPNGISAYGLSVWGYATPSGEHDGWMFLDGALSGGTGGNDRDGCDVVIWMVERMECMAAPDVEVLEASHPMLVTEKRIRRGAFGAGRYRSGGGVEMAFTPHGVDEMTGSLLAVHENMPLPGLAGGFPGTTTDFSIQRGDAPAEKVWGKTPALTAKTGDIVKFRMGASGGYGDPVGRDADTLVRDVGQGRLTAEEAAGIYGVIIMDGVVDQEATTQRRASLLAERLAAADPPVKPLDGARLANADIGGSPLPLYYGVEQRGTVAHAVESGAALAIAPDDWQDGCPVIHTPLEGGWVQDAYLDPSSGRTLLVDVRPEGEPRSIDSFPQHWAEAAES